MDEDEAGSLKKETQYLKREKCRGDTNKEVLKSLSSSFTTNMRWPIYIICIVNYGVHYTSLFLGGSSYFALNKLLCIFVQFQKLCLDYISTKGMNKSVTLALHPSQTLP